MSWTEQDVERLLAGERKPGEWTEDDVASLLGEDDKPSLLRRIWEYPSRGMPRPVDVGKGVHQAGASFVASAPAAASTVAGILGADSAAERLRRQAETVRGPVDSGAEVAGDVVGKMAALLVPYAGAAKGATAIPAIARAGTGAKTAAAIASGVPIDFSIAAADREMAMAPYLVKLADKLGADRAADLLERAQDDPAARGAIDAALGLGIAGTLTGILAGGQKALQARSSTAATRRGAELPRQMDEMRDAAIALGGRVGDRDEALRLARIEDVARTAAADATGSMARRADTRALPRPRPVRASDFPEATARLGAEPAEVAHALPDRQPTRMDEVEEIAGRKTLPRPRPDIVPPEQVRPVARETPDLTPPAATGAEPEPLPAPAPERLPLQPRPRYEASNKGMARGYWKIIDSETGETVQSGLRNKAVASEIAADLSRRPPEGISGSSPLQSATREAPEPRPVELDVEAPSAVEPDAPPMVEIAGFETSKPATYAGRKQFTITARNADGSAGDQITVAQQKRGGSTWELVRRVPVERPPDARPGAYYRSSEEVVLAGDLSRADAVTLAEQYLREGRTTPRTVEERSAALLPSAATPNVKHFDGNLADPASDFVTDGRVMFRRSGSQDPKLANRLGSTEPGMTSRGEPRPTVADSGLKQAWDRAVGRAKNEAEIVGREGQTVYLRSGETLVTFQSDYFNMARRVAGADSRVRIGDVKDPAVFYRGKTPVAVVMPINKEGDELVDALRTRQPLGIGLREGVEIAGGAVVGGTAGGAMAPEGEKLEGVGRGMVLGLTGAALLHGARRGKVRPGRAEAVPRDIGPAGVAPDDLRRAVKDAAREVKAGVEPAAPRGPAADIDINDYINVSKFSIKDPLGIARLEDEVRRVVGAKGWDPKPVIGWEQSIAESLGVSADEIIRDTGMLGRAKAIAARNVVSANANEIADEFHRIQQLVDTDEIKAAWSKIDALEAQNEALLSQVIASRSEAGRLLNSYKIIARNIQSPDFWLFQAKRLKLGRPLLPEETTRIHDLLAAGKTAELAAYVSSLQPKLRPTEARFWTTLFKAGWLSNPATSGRNIVSNAAMAGLEAGKDVPAFFMDRVAAGLLQTGVKAKAMPSVRSLRGMADRGVKTAWQETLQVYKTGLSPEDLAKLDFARERSFANPVLDKATKFLFRNMGAQDRFFYHLAYERALDEQVRLAKVAAPTAEMELVAMAAANEAVFRNRTVLGDMLSGLKRAAMAHGGAAEIATETTFAFTRTPSAVLGKVIGYSPLGLVGAAWDFGKLMRAAKMSTRDIAEITRLQRRFAETSGRAVTGTALGLMLGAYMYKKGAFTGAPPAFGSRESDQAQLENRPWDSVKIGGRFYRLTGIGPIGNIVALGGYIAQMRDEGVELPELAANAAYSIGRTVAEQPFMTGTKQVIEAVSGTRRPLPFVNRVIGGYVPSVVGAAARTADPTTRDPSNPLEAVAARVPGLSRMVPAKIDQFGREITNPEGIVARGTSNLLDPSSGRADLAERDPLLMEMRQVGAGITRLDRRDKSEPNENFRARQIVVGRLTRLWLEQLVNSPEYQALDAEDRRGEIEKEINRVRTETNREFKEMGLLPKEGQAWPPPAAWQRLLDQYR